MDQLKEIDQSPIIWCIFIVLKTFKYRIYPTESQKILLSKHFGATRWVYNWALAKKMEGWNKERKSISIFDISGQLTLIKKNEETKWLKEVSSQALIGALTNLDKAYTGFFKNKKGFPRFKSKHRQKESFQNPVLNYLDWDKNTFSCLKFREGIKINLTRRFEGDIKTVTISRIRSGKYYASIVVDTPDKEPVPPLSIESKAVGLDFGLKDLIITSEGKRFENPRTLKRHLKKLKRLQKSHSRKTKGSKNREKSRLKLAHLYEKISNIRNDNLHKLSHHLVCENQATTLCIEDLSVEDMLKRRIGSNKNLRRSIGDVGWGELRRQLEYKCRWYGKNLRVIGRFEPSSKICSDCSHVNHNLKLADREWTCQCGVHHDRDINAAINIKKMAFREQNTSSKPISRLIVERIPRGARKSKPVEQPVRVAMKQEDRNIVPRNKPCKS